MDNVVLENKETKETYEKTMEARLGRLGSRIDELQETTEKMGVNARVEFYKWMDDLREKQVRARNKFREMKETSGEIWVDFKAGLEKSTDDLKETLDKIGPKIKNLPHIKMNPTAKWLGLLAGGLVAGYFLGRFIHKTKKSA